MKKITICFALLLFLSVRVSAQHPEAMNVQTMIGVNQSILLEKIQNIEFVDDALVFVTTSGIFQIMMEDIQTIVFGKYSNGSTTEIANIEDNEIHISLIEGALSIESKYAINKLHLIDLTGKMILNQKYASTNNVNITLPIAGVYVLFLETTQGYVARKIIND